ncbi:insulin gene enhancer protein ISL-1-like isoform X3 [Chiloscyllium plagiosum]|uniref:insulin gene enhancer protein ISL-1-like isoform X3 n=1 Tax=Chiloscyllium plagiosum TaxID=36176 RepID=UPI001CB85D3A|nr:insulin gene enhancer protein ISL-1-like isoform X3 [Chiloscyllium plagiosum]
MSKLSRHGIVHVVRNLPVNDVNAPMPLIAFKDQRELVSGSSKFSRKFQVGCLLLYLYIFKCRKYLKEKVKACPPALRAPTHSDKITRVRTVLNEQQLLTLRTCYAANPRPDALMKQQLMEMTGLSSRVIRVWFQNKRCKDKKKSTMPKHTDQCDRNKADIQGLVGTLMIATSPLPQKVDLQCSPVEVQRYWPPWEDLSDLTLQVFLEEDHASFAVVVLKCHLLVVNLLTQQTVKNLNHQTSDIACFQLYVNSSLKKTTGWTSNLIFAIR